MSDFDKDTFKELNMKRTILSLLTAALLTACGGSTAPGPQVSLSFSGGPSLSSPNLGSAPSMSDGANALVITSAEIVLREIELKHIEVANCDVDPEPAGCRDFELGPVLINLPVDGTIATQVTIDIEPGTYTEVDFDIHKVSNGNPDDAQFRADHPDLIDTSIRVRGTYNGTSFTYVTDLMDTQKYDLVPSLIIDENTASTNVTIVLDLSTWFVDAQGSLVDPASANKGEANDNLVRDNIKASIRVFEDADRDGSD
jgi:hypothetical protein